MGVNPQGEAKNQGTHVSSGARKTRSPLLEGQEKYCGNLSRGVHQSMICWNLKSLVMRKRRRKKSWLDEVRPGRCRIFDVRNISLQILSRPNRPRKRKSEKLEDWGIVDNGQTSYVGWGGCT